MTILGSIYNYLRSSDSEESMSAAPSDTRHPTYQRALTEAWAHGLPSAASAIHARWWQLETWLRSLVYVELHANYGTSWADELPKRSISSSAKDQARHAYMATPDATNYLAFLDVGDLFDIIEGNWSLFKPSIIDDEAAWRGKVTELKTIRRRMAHCRRPHDDDLKRIEQALRDIENGSFRALASFNRRSVPPFGLNDPVVGAWLRREHPRSGLIDHADSNYYTRLRLSTSRRPWADERHSANPVSGSRGHLWHATWTGGNGELDLRDWWDEVDQWRHLIVYVCTDSPGYLDVSFAAIDDPHDIAEAIECCFSAYLHNQGIGWRDLDEHNSWRRRFADLDPRVQVDTLWARVEAFSRPISVFGA